MCSRLENTAAKIAARILGCALAAALFCLAPSLGRAGSIAGTAHDFSKQGWAGGQICRACHTPHEAKIVPDAPLWNHQITTKTYTPYTTWSGTQIGQPDGVSKLCLSCHDGTVAIDAYGMMTGKTYVTTPLDPTNDHPISFVYDSTLAASSWFLFDPATTQTPLGGTIAQDLLSDGKVQCTSCHDVHNRYNNPKLFKIPNDNDQLCLTCHDM